MPKHKAPDNKLPTDGRRARRATTGPRRQRATALDETRSREDQERKVEKFHGILQDFNFSPKGGVEGFLLHSDGQTVQVNVSSEVGIAVVRGMGQNVEVTVEPEAQTARPRKGNHPVYRLVTLTGADGKPLIFAGLGDSAIVTVQGTVKRINYTRQGEANGVILDSWDFIYLKTEGMKRAGLKVGDHVTAEGPSGMMPLGQRVIEAKTVNGISLAGRKPARTEHDGAGR
jgi:hypothetical protein